MLINCPSLRPSRNLDINVPNFDWDTLQIKLWIYNIFVNHPGFKGFRDNACTLRIDK